MASGKHTGVRTNVTLPKDVDAAYVEVAAALGLRKASLLREVLSSAVPYLASVTGSLNALKENPAQAAEDILARLLWKALRELPGVIND